MRPHLAIYAGTFDPITSGHLSVIRRAQSLFGHVLVVVAVNPDKRPLFQPEERITLIKEAAAMIPNVECATLETLIADFAREKGATVLVRGIRSVTDVEIEMALANFNSSIAPEILTVFIPSEPEFADISSSRLKEMAARGEDVTAFCPANVARRLSERLRDGFEK